MSTLDVASSPPPALPPTPGATPPAPHDWSTEPPLAVSGIAYFAPLYGYAVLADRKAAFLMSAGGLMLTVLGFFLVRIGGVIARPGWLAWSMAALLAAVAVLVLVAAVTAYVAYRRVLPPIPPSLAVFRDIARRSFDQYERDVFALSHAEAFTQMLRFNHVVAVWTAGKFHLVNRALALLAVAIPLWMLVLLVLAIAG